MDPLHNFDIDANFWEVNPEMKILFKDIFKKDKSKSKDKSSRLMWSLFLYDHPKSKFNNLEDEFRKEIIEADYYGEPIEWDKHTETLELINKACLTRLQRSMKQFFKKLEERDAFLNTEPYNMGNAKELDAIISNTEKLHKLYDMLMEKLSKEDATGTVRGGSVESATEMGLL